MPWDPPGPIDDMMIAALPYPTAQRLLRGALVPNASYRVTCEWHGAGPDGDPDRGSFALVQEGGPLEGLVGERVQITYRRVSIFALVKDTADLDDPISVTRTLFARLAVLSGDSLPVVVEVVA